MPSSGVLAICLFLPFFRMCGKESLALHWPMFWSPYIVGALVLGAALARPRSYDAFALALRLALSLALGVGCCLGMLAALDGDAATMWTPLAFAAAIGLLIAVCTSDRPELVIARCGVAAGAAAAVWFAAVASSRDALYGAQVALVASCVMAIGCLWWFFEVPPSR